MTKTIDTLQEDIYHLLDDGTETAPIEGLASAAGAAVANELSRTLETRDKPREKGKLWASDLGKPCMRQHWYNFNEPEHGEKLMGHTKFKFLYGNLLEEAALYLAEQAGHDVRAKQERIEVEFPNGWTVSGRIDAVLDDVLVDVKSTSSYGYKKYSTEGLNEDNDSFGYRYQLGFYKHYADIDGLEDVQGFVWIDKQNGHIQYMPSSVPDKGQLEERIREIALSVNGSEVGARKEYTPEPYGKSGNLKLGMACSYCPYKHRCYRDSNDGKGLRGFVYSHGPVWMTNVTNEPKVPEITEDYE